MLRKLDHPVLVALLVCACTDFQSPDARSRQDNTPAPQFSASPADYGNIAVANDHGCVLHNGAAECWGDNTYGQAPASRTPSASTYIALSAGMRLTCGLRADGEIDCWGEMHGSSAAGSSLGLDNVQVSSEGGEFGSVACGLKTSGHIQCNGYLNSYDQNIGPATGTFVQVRTSILWVVGLRSDGAAEFHRLRNSHSAPNGVVSASTGVFTELTAFPGFCGLRSDGMIECAGVDAAFQSPSGSYAQVRASGYLCGLRSDGAIDCWDSHFARQPVKRARSGSFTEMTVGNLNVCALHSSGRIACFGSGAGIRNDFPPAPANVTTSVAASVITVSWQAGGSTPHTTDIHVARSSVGSGFTEVAALSSAAADYVDTNATPGLVYRYRVFACNDIGCSSSTTAPVVLETVPAGPADLNATASGPQHVDVAWTDASSNEAGFQVQRRTLQANGKWSAWMLVGAPSQNAAAFSDTGVYGNTTYQYEMQSCNAVTGCSAFGAAAQVTTPAGGPSPPVPGGGVVPAYLGGGLYGQTCAVRTSGNIECWGNRLGPSSTIAAVPSFVAAAGYFVQASAGTWYVCGLRTDGVVQCNDSRGARTAQTGTFTQVAAGGSTSNAFLSQVNCALRSDGAIECWGAHSGALDATRTALSGKFTQVIQAPPNVCGLRDDGAAECWSGPNTAGGTSVVTTASAGSFTHISAAFGFDSRVCGTRTDGKIECWTFGETVGSGAHAAQRGKFMQSAGNEDFTCGLRTDAAVECWSDFDLRFPAVTRAFNGGTFTQVAAGIDVCALRSDALVQCWGVLLRSDYSLAPTGMSAALVSGVINLGWTDNTSDGRNETRFEIQRQIRSVAGGAEPWLYLLPADTNASAQPDALLLPDFAYRYRVRSCNGLGCTAWATSNFVATATVPGVPTNVSATPASGHVDVAWTDASTNEMVFNIQRRLVGGTWQLAGDAAAGQTGFTDSDVAPGSQYDYRVQACAATACSPWSVSVRVTAH